MTRLCAHPTCTNPIVRRPGEKPSRFAKRRCCSAPCAKSVARGAAAALPGRTCCQCSTTLRRRAGETSAQYMRRKHCSLTCAGLSKRRTTQAKPCAECGTQTCRREGESTGQWGERRFCSAVCASRNRTRVSVGLLPATKPCEGCSKQMPRRPGEKSNRWRDRRFCSRTCRYTPGAVTTRPQHAAKQQQPQGPIEEKACVLCGTVYQRLPRRTWSTKKWGAKKFCSTACASRSRHTPDGQARAATRKPVTRKPAPQPVVLTMEEMRPAPENLLPDPAVTAMDVKRQAAERLLDNGAEPADIATELGVSLAQVRRWDEGAA